MAERAGLLNRCTGFNLYRGFESLPLRSSFLKYSGRSVARLSRHIWDVEAASSNLAAPTIKEAVSSIETAFLFLPVPRPVNKKDHPFETAFFFKKFSDYLN